MELRRPGRVLAHPFSPISPSISASGQLSSHLEPHTDPGVCPLSLPELSPLLGRFLAFPYLITLLLRHATSTHPRFSLENFSLGAFLDSQITRGAPLRSPYFLITPSLCYRLFSSHPSHRVTFKRSRRRVSQKH